MKHARFQWPENNRATQMRADFDGAFARAPQQPQTDLENVLALRLGDQRCLLRLAEVAEVIARPVLTAVPSPAPALIGLASSRGSVIAVYDLALLTGRPPQAPQWLVIAAAMPGVAVAFQTFEGYQRITRDHVDSALVIELGSIIEAIRALGAPPPGRLLPALDPIPVTVQQHRSGA